MEVIGNARKTRKTQPLLSRKIIANNLELNGKN